VQDERLLAQAGALALPDLVCKARARAVLQAHHLETELMRERDVDLRLARILLGVKDAEALHEIREIHAVDGDGQGTVRLARRGRPSAATQGVRLRLALAALVVQRLPSPDPLGFPEDRSELAGGLHPIDAPYFTAQPAILGIGALRCKVAGYTAAK